MGGHTVNRDVGYGVHSYINLKILGGHVPVCPPYEYGPVNRLKNTAVPGGFKIVSAIRAVPATVIVPFACAS